MVRNEILAGIPDRYLDVFEDNSAIEWEEEGKEFSIKGEFFDVVRIKIVNGKRLLFCLNDKNDEQLIKNFAKTVKSSNEDEKGKNNKNSFKFHLIDQNIVYVISTLPSEHLIRRTYFYYKTGLVTTSREIIIPPPWRLLS